MTNSNILRFLYTKWLALWALFRYSGSYKIMHETYRGISHAWTNSAIVSAFCRDTKAGENSKSLVYRLMHLPFAFLGLFAGKAGVAVADWWRSTRLYQWLYSIVSNLIALETRFLGVLLLSGGGIYALATRSLALIPLAMMALGAVLCLFHFSIMNALCYSIVRRFLKTFLGIEPTFRYYDEAETEKKSRLGVAAVSGVLLGFAAAYFSPVVAAGILGVLIVLFNIEFGIGITIFAIPFLPTMAAAGLGLLCFVSLILKKAGSGDRQWRLDAVGMLIMLFMAVFLICSLCSSSWKSSIDIFILYLAFICFYFTIINTIKTKEQLYSMLMVFVISGFFVAAYGVIQYVFGLDMDKQVWIDTEMFSDIKMRAFSTLENPNVLGEYLLLVIPVAIAFLWRKNGIWTKTAFAVILGVLGLCLILTMSRGCWIALILAAAVYITFVDGRYWLLAILVLFALPTLLPQSILNRFLSIGDLEDTSSSYRLFIWLGTISMLQDYWLTGIGPGNVAFNTIYPQYSYASVIAPHSHNLYLQLMTEMGISGLVAFLAICIIFFRQMAAGAKKAVFKSLDRAMIVAISAGVLAFLAQGMFDYVLYNYRVVMVFWMVLALGMCFRHVIAETKEASND